MVLAGTEAAQSSPSNFTPRAQQALAIARKEAERLNHDFVGTEHLLLGIIRHGQGVAVNVLKRMGLELETIRMEVEKFARPGEQRPADAPYTPRVKRVLAFAANESRELKHMYVGTEHVLLGLLHKRDGVAARVLRSQNVLLEATRKEILKELDPNLEA